MYQQLRRAALLVLVLAFLTPGSVLADLAVEVGLGGEDPMGSERTVVGWAAVESFGKVAVGVTVDVAETGAPDGRAEYVVRYTAGDAISPSLYFRGDALVHFEDRSLRIVPLDGSEVIVLAVDSPAGNGEGERRLVGGLELIVEGDRDFRSGEAEIAALRREARRARVGLVTAAVEEENQPSPPSGGSGGCASSCSISCAGGGGSCSAECHRTKCAECECQEEQNLASCRCN